jgi:hypothetical protein
VGVGSNPTSDSAFWLDLLWQKQMKALTVFEVMEASMLIVFDVMDINTRLQVSIYVDMGSNLSYDYACCLLLM